MNKVVISIVCCFFTFSLSANDSALHKTVNDLAKRISRIEKAPHVGGRGFVGDVISFASSHPLLTTTAAVAAVCYSQRSRALMRTGWGWLTASAEYFLGKDSWTIAGMHAVGFAADKAEVVLKELNGEASQEAVIQNLKKQVSTSSSAITELQQRLLANEQNYQKLLIKSKNINNKLSQTTEELAAMTSKLTQVQQDELTAKLQADRLEKDFESKYTALQQTHAAAFATIAEKQRVAVGTMNQQLRATQTAIAELKQSIERLTAELTAQIKSHAATYNGKMNALQQQVAGYNAILKNLERQESELQAGLQKIIAKKLHS